VDGNFIDTPVHQWVTQQAYEFYADQFGISDVADFLGAVSIYPNGPNTQLIEGAFDDDVPFENPWNEGGGFQDLNHPSTRHLWAHDANYARRFDDGIAGYDSAANRAVKFFTGGFGLTNVLDDDWGASTRPGNVASQGQGIDEIYAQNTSQAYYWLGHVAHLLQDLTLPSHSHADAHADRGLLADPDPLHDWTDGAVFSTNPSGDRPEAAFDDATPRRWESWRFRPGIGMNGSGGVGRVGGTIIDSGPIRTADQVLQQVQSRFGSEPELAASIPADARTDVLALYAQLLETAALADDYDTEDAIGQVDRGSRRGSTSSSGSGYDQFTRDELNQMADILVPRAMRATAELLRYFYSVVETATGAGPPVVALLGIGQRPQNDPLQSADSRVMLTAAATDQDSGDSGVAKDLFRFEYRERAPGGTFSEWRLLSTGVNSSTFIDGGALSPQFAGKHGAAATTQFQGLPGYTYGFRVSAEDGAGKRRVSQESYVQISPTADGPVPETAGLYSAAGGTFFLRYFNQAGPADNMFAYGPAGRSLLPLAGDWDGSANPGGDTIGLFDAAPSVFFLRNDNSAGVGDTTYVFGPAGANWLPLAGDWNGNGVDTVGLFDPATSTFFLRNSHAAGPADVVFNFGPAGANWVPLAGDWDGDGDDSVGLFNPATSTFYFRNSLTAGAADAVVAYGPPGAGWIPLPGDWDGDGDDTLGLFNRAASSFFLRNTLSPGAADIVFGYGPAGSAWLPIVGQWQRSSQTAASSLAIAAVAVEAQEQHSTTSYAEPASAPSTATSATSQGEYGLSAADGKDAGEVGTILSDELPSRRRHRPRRELEVVFGQWV